MSSQKYAPGADIWLAAGQELGYSVEDANGPQQISTTNYFDLGSTEVCPL